MLSRFFNSVLTSHPSQLDSSIDDAYTRGLLFPYANPSETIYDHTNFGSSSTANGASCGDDSDGGDLQMNGSNDVRIVIAQDDSEGTGRPSMLYDSKPPPPFFSATGSNGVDPRPKTSGEWQSPRTGIVQSFIDPESSKQSRLVNTSRSVHHAPLICPGFDSLDKSPGHASYKAVSANRIRGSSISSMPNIDEDLEDGGRDHEDQFMRNCLECMFGKHKLSYKGVSTKLHVMSAPAAEDVIQNSIRIDSIHFNKADRRDQAQLSNSLPQSSPKATDHPNTSNPNRSDAARPERIVVMITQTFNLPTFSGMHSASTMEEKAKAAPSQNVDSKGGAHSKARKNIHLGTPTFAVAAILQFPLTLATTSPQQVVTQYEIKQSSFSAASSFLVPPLDARDEALWSFRDPLFAPPQASLGEEYEALRVLTQHLDIFQRVLTSLQSIVEKKLLHLLSVPESSLPRSAQTASPGTTSPHPGQLSRRSVARFPANQLSQDRDVSLSVALSVHRIVTGLRTPRVVTGQGRWNTWREEAKCVERWPRRPDNKAFLLKLITVYLSLHRTWLSQYAPDWYRGKLRQHEKSCASDEIILKERTIIVSPSKAEARRILFLLSHFILPSGFDGYKAFRGDSLASVDSSAAARSPFQRSQTQSSIRRQRSSQKELRQQDNLPGNTLNDLSDGTTRILEATTAPSESLSNRRTETFSPALETEKSDRRASDAQLARSLTAYSSGNTRRSSSATTSIITGALSIAYLSKPIGDEVPKQGADSKHHGRSAGSAPPGLTETLNRYSSVTSSDTHSKKGWSFWGSGGSHSASSTIHSDSLPSSWVKTSSILGAETSPRQAKNKLEEMVAELNNRGPDGELYADDLDEDFEHSRNMPQSSNRRFERAADTDWPESPAARRTTFGKRDGSCTGSPLKMSVGSDGVIDIDIPFSRPTSAGHSSTGFGENDSSPRELSSKGHSLYPFQNRLGSAADVAGFLPRFQEDFALQAVSPYPDLEANVKRAMSMEPTPTAALAISPSDQVSAEKWVEICTSLIADTRASSIKRLRLKRKIRLHPIVVASITAPRSQMMRVKSRTRDAPVNPNITPMVPMAEEQLEEKFVEDFVTDFDDVLAGAMEQVFTASLHPNKVPSAGPPRPSLRTSRNQRVNQEVRFSQASEVLAADPGRILSDALRTIVTLVQESRSKERTENAGGLNDGVGKGQSKRSAVDGCLREGVRKWLEEIEAPVRAS